MKSLSVSALGRNLTLVGLAMTWLNVSAAPTAATQEDIPPPVPQGRPAREQYHWREERCKALAQAGGFDVMFIGDSITQDWENRGRAVWEKKIAPLKAANFGFNGDCTEQVLWRLAHGNLEGRLNPAVIVLMIGTNNTDYQKDKPEHIAAGVSTIVTKLHHRFPKAQLLLLGIFPRGAKPDDSARINNDAANKLLAQLDGYSNTHYMNINVQFLEKDGTISTEIMPDFLHLSAKGYQIWANAILPQINDILTNKR